MAAARADLRSPACCSPAGDPGHDRPAYALPSAARGATPCASPAAATVAAVHAAHAGLAPARPGRAAAPPALADAVRRARASRRHGRRARRGGVGDARHGRSGSMRANDVDPTRLDAARKAAGNFLGQGPRPDARRRRRLLRRAEHGHPPRPTTATPHTRRSTVCVADGGTATGDAMQAALDALTSLRRGPACPRPRSCCSPTARDHGRATRSRSPARRRRPACRSTPSRSAPDGRSPSSGPGGSIPRPARPRGDAPRPRPRAASRSASGDADQLSAVYERLGSQLGTKQEEREITAVFAGGGLILLLGAAFAGLRTTGRLP